jgi:excisionase family DNA binding protein
MLNTREVAKQIGVTQPAVCYWLREGHMKGTWTSRGWKVNENEVNRFMREKTGTKIRNTRILKSSYHKNTQEAMVHLESAMRFLRKNS